MLGVGTVISKAALDEMPPFTLLPIQLAASLAVLAILMRRQGISFRTEGSPLLGRLGLLNPGLAYALGLLGLTTITASLYVLLWALEPLMILFLAAWFLRERITPTFVALSLVAVAGMAVIVYDPCVQQRPDDRRRTDPGGHRLLRRLLRRHPPLDPGRQGDEPGHPRPAGPRAGPRPGTGRHRRTGRRPGRPDRTDTARLASAVGSGALYYAGAYWFYLGALRHVPASFAAVSFYLIPIVGVAAGALLLGERLDLRQWVGAVIVLGALLAILRQPSARPDESPVAATA